MKQLTTLFTLLLLFNSPIFSQSVNYTANDFIPEYNGPFGYGTNMGYHPNWTDEQLADIAAGNSALNISGAGCTTMRPALFEHFLEDWGYDVRMNAFDHYSSLNMNDNVVFIGYPSEAHREDMEYCEGQRSELFKNMYDPIWDNGENGTPVNDENFYALYLYKMVTRYKDHVKFWEVWNEPDLDLQGNGWKPSNMDGNWWTNDPAPCEFALRAPIYSYVRLLRISYEVIKSIDPDSYVCVGGLGYPSFLDAVMRNTDNPSGGTVGEEFPLKGGAYFDVMSYHSYPHIEGWLREWNNDKGDFDYFRHSDAAAKGVISKKEQFETVLESYGYDGDIFPKKPFIITETNIPSRQFGENIGSEDAQCNFIIKSLIETQKAGILQYHIYNLGEAAIYDANLSEFNFMGIYESLANIELYTHKITSGGVAFKTTSEILKGYEYDEEATIALGITDQVGGGAFKNNLGQMIYVLWAKTQNDLSENASATYSFPNTFGINQLDKIEWNYSQNPQTVRVNAANIQLNASPVFLRPVVNTTGLIELENDFLELKNQPNPFTTETTISFNLESSSEVSIDIYNQQGQLVHTVLAEKELTEGAHQVPFNNERLNTGVFICLLRTNQWSKSIRMVKLLE